MANTANIGKSATATAGRGQGGKRRFGDRLYHSIGLAAIAVVILGLGAGAIINRTRTAAVPAAAPSTASNPYWEYVEDVPIDAPQSVLTNPFAYDTHVYTEWDFREDRRVPVPADASTSTDYLWDFGAGYAPVPPVGLVPTFDWEQQERTQVAPGTVPNSPTILPGSCQAGTSDCPPGAYYGPPPADYPLTQVAPGAVPPALVSVPGPWLGTCRAGNVDCLPDGDYPVSALPATPPVYAGTCRAGSSDCLPDGDYLPGQDY